MCRALRTNYWLFSSITCKWNFKMQAENYALHYYQPFNLFSVGCGSADSDGSKSAPPATNPVRRGCLAHSTSPRDRGIPPAADLLPVFTQHAFLCFNTDMTLQIQRLIGVYWQTISSLNICLSPSYGELQKCHFNRSKWLLMLYPQFCFNALPTLWFWEFSTCKRHPKWRFTSRGKCWF